MITARYSFLFMAAVAITCCTDPALSDAAQPRPLSVGTQRPGQHSGTEAALAAQSGARFAEERWAGQCRTMTVLTRGVVAEAGASGLELVVRNSGDRSVAPDLSVDLFQTGQEVAQFRTTLRAIPPGGSLRHRIDLSELPPGRYQALTIVQNRDGDISGMREELDIQ